MYALIHNDEIKVGPRSWNNRVFEFEYYDLTGQTTSLPVEYTGIDVITIDPTTRIVPVEYLPDEGYNPKIEQPTGPSLTVEQDRVVAQMGKADRDINVVKGELKGQVSALRWEKETNGIIVSGSPVKTDRESQATLSGAVNYLALSPLATIDWKMNDGSWVQMNRTQIETIAVAVAQHVQVCFTQEKTYAQQIDACTTLAQLDALEFTF